MKTWTVVVEINQNAAPNSKEWIEEIVSDYLKEAFGQFPDMSFRIMETIPAPYGPQHPNGVFIAGKDGKPA